MRKKLLLAVLPALMVLSACNNGGAQKNEENKNIFLEDTLAHDEIFDNRNFDNRELMPRRVDPVEHPDTDSDISIGVQSFTEGENVHFRFVAAVSFGDGQLTPTIAKWRRTVSSPDGTEYPMDTADIACSTAYKKISNGGSAYSIEQFNGEHGNTNYTHFVVYTLRNIPVATYGSYYVSAYLNLSGDGGLNQITKAIAIRVDQDEKYTYVHNVGEYFLTGSFTNTPIKATTVRPEATYEDPTPDVAKFETGYNLNAGDTAVINEFYDTKLYVHGYSQRAGAETPYYFSNDNNQLKAKYKGNYKFFLNASSGVASWGQNVVRPLYVSLADNSVKNWWEGSGVFTALYAYVNGGAAQWYKLDSLGDHLYVTKEAIDPTIYDRVIVARIDKTIENNDSSSWWTSGKVYNQTRGGDDSTTSIPHNTTHDHAYAKQEYANGPCYIEWWD